MLGGDGRRIEVAAAPSPIRDASGRVTGLSLVFLAILGAVAARVGRAHMLAGALRVTFWSALAMAVTAAIGRLFGVIA